MARNIKVIPSTVPLHAVGPVVTGAKRRVAAYARVSTDRDEQFTSYEAQIDYYNGEYDRYNNSVAAVNSTLQAFENHHHRTHRMPSTAFTEGGVVL